MKWFKKLCQKSDANQNNDKVRLARPANITVSDVINTAAVDESDDIKEPDTNDSTHKIDTNKSSHGIMEEQFDISKSLVALDNQAVEMLDPEDFFDDPEHVRNYKEEAQFLKLMSEWEIVENPSTTYANNYFSADFEEELLHLKTQGCNEANYKGECPVFELEEQIKLKLYELLCGNRVQLGITLPIRNSSRSPLSMPSTPVSGTLKRRKHVKKRRIQTSLENLSFTTSSDTDTANANTQMHTEVDSGFSSKSGTTTKLFNSVSESMQSDSQQVAATCQNSIIKDCAIDRKKLKTEALASSIMGAIGKCPDQDSATSGTSDNEHTTAVSSTTDAIELVKVKLERKLKNRDLCHPARYAGCDHYDIKKFYHLDDFGNILLNTNHIPETKGFGFAVAAQNKRLYHHYRKECEIIEEDEQLSKCCAIGCGFSLLMKSILQSTWNNIVGHPRNKISPYSGNAGGPGGTVRTYTMQLAQDPTSTFARNIENFISCTKESREAAPQVVMRNMRQFMNGMKNYLVKHGEGRFQSEVEAARGRLKSDEFLNLDAILETVMHQLVVLPLREHLYGMFVDYYTRSDDIQLLAQNIKYACARNASDFGIRATVTPPSTQSLNMISNLLLRLQEAELPLDKLDLFLCVISTVFEATGCPRGQQLGADDFLPVLVYVVAKCGFVGAEIEAEFMWGLLQPTLLNGEPGYYLTALCSAVHVLKSFMASENESGMGSLDWRSSSLPACSSVLRVIIPDECNGSLQTRTLPVRPHTTTREVCRIIAHKARITNPQDYALFKLVDGEETLLNDMECPQDVRLAAKGKHCMLAYKRIDAKIAWPTATQPTYKN